MDPDANFRERIALYTDPTRNRAVRERVSELAIDYSNWLRTGGFPASRNLRDELRALQVAEAGRPDKMGAACA